MLTTSASLCIGRFKASTTARVYTTTRCALRSACVPTPSHAGVSSVAAARISTALSFNRLYRPVERVCAG